MGERPIASAIKEFTAHIRKYSGQTLWDTNRLHTAEEESERKESVLAVCEELDSLANTADADDSTFRDFEHLRQKLSELGAYAKDDHVMAVANAYRDAGRLDRK